MAALIPKYAGLAKYAIGALAGVKILSWAKTKTKEVMMSRKAKAKKRARDSVKVDIPKVEAEI